MSLIRLLALLALLLGAQVSGADPDPNSDEFWYGTAADGTPTVRLYYFFSPTCPHCQAAAPYIEELKARWPWLEVKKYSVKDNRPNAKFYYETALSLGTKALSVPGFVFCRQVLIGYDTAETTGAEIARALESCHEQRLADPTATVPDAASAARRHRHDRRTRGVALCQAAAGHRDRTWRSRHGACPLRRRLIPVARPRRAPAIP